MYWDALGGPAYPVRRPLAGGPRAKQRGAAGGGALGVVLPVRVHGVIDRPLLCGLGVHAADKQPASGLVTSDRVAGQLRAEDGLGRQRAMRESRVAGAEDAVGPLLDAELGLHGGLHVDLGQDAEALGLQGLGDARNAAAEILLVEVAVKAVGGCVLRGR